MDGRGQNINENIQLPDTENLVEFRNTPNNYDYILNTILDILRPPNYCYDASGVISEVIDLFLSWTLKFALLTLSENSVYFRRK